RPCPLRSLPTRRSSDLHVQELRRLWVDPFRDPRMWAFEELELLASRGRDSLAACLLPVEAGMGAWPALVVDAGQARRLSFGQSVDRKSTRLHSSHAEVS